MNNNLPTNGSTRRSFIKKSVVAAVAASSMTIFSGLVKADEGDGAYGCVAGQPMSFSKTNTGVGHQFPDGSIHWIHDCTATAGAGCCQSATRSCGQFSKAGQMGVLENVNVAYNPGNNQTVQCY